MIIKAELKDADIVKKIAAETISAVYPHYYPEGAVSFFLAHHSQEHIVKDIEEENVWLLVTGDGSYAGTVTVNGCEINRLFVLPEYQGRGYGRELLDHAEALVTAEYDRIELSASLPAKGIYLKRGYTSTGFFMIDTENGDKLCYDYMEKKVSK